MEDNFDTPHPDYVKGFNEGYVLTKYSPQLANEIAASMPVSERSSGFKDGKTQVENELAKEKYPKFLQKDRSKIDKNNPSPDRSKVRDRGIEPDRD